MSRDFAQYDTRHYQTLAVTEGYAAWSVVYDEQLDGKLAGNLDTSLLEQLTSVDWSSVATIVDLACGTGRISAWLASRGAGKQAIDGVDLTREMLAVAKSKGIYRHLVCEDLTATSLASASADLIVNSMALCHVPALAAAYREADRLLAPDGTFILIDYHPFFLLSGIPTHFRDRDGEQWAIHNSVHLFSDHFAAASEPGWRLVEMHERVVSDDWTESAPSWQKYVGKPVTFAMVWRKPAARGGRP